MKLISKIVISIATSMTTSIALSTVYMSSASLFEKLNTPNLRAYGSGFIVGAQDHMFGRGGACVPDHISIGQLISDVEQGYIKYPKAKLDTVLPANMFIEMIFTERYPCKSGNSNR
jgi:hypothetical protein